MPKEKPAEVKTVITSKDPDIKANEGVVEEVQDSKQQKISSIQKLQRNQIQMMQLKGTFSQRYSSTNSRIPQNRLNEQTFPKQSNTIKRDDSSSVPRSSAFSKGESAPVAKNLQEEP